MPEDFLRLLFGHNERVNTDLQTIMRDGLIDYLMPEDTVRGRDRSQLKLVNFDASDVVDMGFSGGENSPARLIYEEHDEPYRAPLQDTRESVAKGLHNMMGGKENYQRAMGIADLIAGVPLPVPYFGLP